MCNRRALYTERLTHDLNVSSCSTLPMLCLLTRPCISAEIISHVVFEVSHFYLLSEPLFERHPPGSKIQAVKAMDRELLRDLLQHDTTSSREILAQNQPKNHLQRRDSQYELYISNHVAVFSNLTIQGIMSLRNGPFTLLPNHIPDIDLRSITHLDLAIVPFGEPEPRVVISKKKAEDDSKQVYCPRCSASH